MKIIKEAFCMTVAVWSLPELWRRHVASGFRLCVLSPRSSSSSLSSPHFHFTSPPPPPTSSLHTHLLSSSLPIFLSPSHLYLIVFLVFAFFLLFLIFVVIFFVHFFITAASFFNLFFLFFIFPFLPPPCLYVGVQFHFVINVSLSLMEEMVLSPVNSPRGSKHRVLSCGRLGYKATTIQPVVLSHISISRP